MKHKSAEHMMGSKEMKKMMKKMPIAMGGKKSMPAEMKKKKKRRHTIAEGR